MQLHAEPAEHDFTLRPKLSPDVVLDVLNVRQGQLFVAREDLLPGGTKQRACLPYLQDQIRLGHRQFIYASPFAGFAQVALAFCASQLDCEVRLYCEKDPTVDEPAFHAFSKLARHYGATIILCESLGDAEREAAAFAAKNRRSYKIPLGFDCDGFRGHLKTALSEQWKNISRVAEPSRVWVALGSGTLSKTLREVVPGHVKISAVNVHVLKGDDVRVRAVTRLPNTSVYSAPEKFAEEAVVRPLLPSNIHYDSKVWQFIDQYSQDGDLWWNVAR